MFCYNRKTSQSPVLETIVIKFPGFVCIIPKCFDEHIAKSFLNSMDLATADPYCRIQLWVNWTSRGVSSIPAYKHWKRWETTQLLATSIWPGNCIRRLDFGCGQSSDEELYTCYIQYNGDKNQSLISNPANVRSAIIKFWTLSDCNLASLIAFTATCLQTCADSAKWRNFAVWCDLVLLQDLKDWRGMLNSQVKSYREVSWLTAQVLWSNVLGFVRPFYLWIHKFKPILLNIPSFAELSAWSSRRNSITILYADGDCFIREMVVWNLHVVRRK